MVPALFYGVIAAGGVYSAASPSSTVSELSRQIEVGGSRLVVCGTDLRDVAVRAAEMCGVGRERVLVLESSPECRLRNVEGSRDVISDEGLDWMKIEDERQLKESLIVILWSSGTTGPPKGEFSELVLLHADEMKV